MKRGIIFFIFSLFYFSSLLKAQELKTASDNDKFWKERISHLPAFKKVFKKYKKYRLEVIYTQIDRNAENNPVFTQYHFGDKEQYFYPASTVKLPLAVFALEKIYSTGGSIENQLQFDSAAFCNGHQYKNYFHTWYRVKKDETFSYIAHKLHKPVDYLSELNPGTRTDTILKENSLVRISLLPSLITIRELLTEMLMFSSNEAFNKLFELATPDYVNARIKEHGYANSAINRRLMYCADDWQKKSQVFSVHRSDTTFLSMEYTRKWHEEVIIEKEGIKVGKKIMGDDGKISKGGKDFTGHNSVSLSDLHVMLLRLVFMENIPEKKKFTFSRFEQRFLLRMLGLHPRELERLRDSSYASLEDGYTNFILNGNSKENFPHQLRSINIMGQAYGFTTDCAYIFDTKNKVEFMLSVRIYTNNDNILNDDKYEYDEIALPLMEALGKEIHAYEIQRKREVVPNLNYFYSLFK